MSEYITDPELLKKLNKTTETSSDGYVTDPELLSKLNEKPKSAMPKPVEGEGGAAFGVYRPAGRRPESQQDREASKEMPIQTARGVATGTLGAIPDLLNLPGQIYGMATKQPAPYTVPLGSEEWNKILPGYSDTPHANLARFAGQAVAPIPTVKGVQAAIRAPGQVMRTGRELTEGAMEGMRNPVYQQNAKTAFAPLEQTYYPSQQVEKFQSMPAGQRPGMLPELEASKLPSEGLFNTPGQLLAKSLGPKTEAGQTLIPYQGQTARAFGETVGRDIATSPFKTAGLPSIAGATIGTLVGGPIGGVIGAGLGAAANPLVRGAELMALNKLGKTAGFAPNFPEQLAQARQAAGPVAGPVAPAPTSTALTVQGPGQQLPPSTIPMPGPQRNVNIEGQSFNLPRDINVSNSQAATPKQISMEVAASKIKPTQPMPQQVAGPVQPTQLPPQPPAAPAPQMQPQPKQSTPVAQPAGTMTGAQRGQIVKDWVEGTKTVKGSPLLTEKGSYGGSNLTDRQVKDLIKAGIDEVPVLQGATDKQVIDAMHGYITKNKPELFTTRKKKAPSNVSQMLVGESAPSGPLAESIVSKRSFNSDLQKYRYGTEKNPLTMEEFRHLNESTFIQNQNMKDRLLGMKPELTEYSIWYKDKTGKIHNKQTHGGEFGK